MHKGNVTVGKLVALLIVVLLGLPIESEAGGFWTEDFENHLTPNWDTSSCSNGATFPGPQDGCNPSITTAIAHSGTHSLYADYTNCPITTNPNGCGAFYDRPHPGSTELYTRFYYYTSGFTYWAASETKHFFHKWTQNVNQVDFLFS